MKEWLQSKLHVLKLHVLKSNFQRPMKFPISNLISQADSSLRLEKWFGLKKQKNSELQELTAQDLKLSDYISTTNFDPL